MKNVMNKIKKPLIIIVLGLLIVGYYLFLTNRKVDNNDNIAKNTPVTNITERDLTLNYPGSPRSVITFYSDILKVIYTERLSEEELKAISRKLLGLFDEELRMNNPDAQYLERLRNEISEYKSASRTVADYLVEDNSYIKYMTYQKRDCAKVDVVYFVHEGKKVIKTYEKFTLRKDESDKWKILYWEVGKEEDMNN